MDLDKAKVPAEFKDCLCPDCLKLFIEPVDPTLTKDDYVVNDQGLMVFTKAYHIKRGYCCNSGCFNCPY